ncbi:MAG: Na(+)-translocating NADH-quinone reductase subunit A [Saprospiraceae bacterium]|nr:Na(+)-translocating NADH-quinone reductase subunit A [Saprospiraceae bacterium]
MKNGITKASLFLLFLFTTDISFAQGDATSGNSIFSIALIAIAILLVLVVIVVVGDNLLALEAKRTGVSEKGGNVSIFPKWAEIMRPKMPAHIDPDNVTVLKQGHDILLLGEAAPDVIETASVTRFAIQPKNFRGLAPIPKMLVEEGVSVKAGDPLFFDKSNPDVVFGAPVSGEVISIHRGEKRAIDEVIILADKEIQYRDLGKIDLEKTSREDLVKHLIGSGAWNLFRQRPFDLVANPADVPNNIFISTFDTAPLAPDLNLVVAGNEAAFQAGINTLAKLTSGKVHIGLDGRRELAPSTAFTQAANAEVHWFHGKHPAGNVGIQIHHIDPITPSSKVWTLGVQEVISLGTLISEGKYDCSRMIALGGSEVIRPRYVRTYAGANIKELLQGEIAPGNVRIISGDVLSGSQKSEDQFLNFYDDQVTVIKEGDYYELFGWLLPLSPRPSVSNTFPNFLYPSLKFEADTNTHGEKRAFVMTGQYEKVLPMDIYPQHLMKSIIVNDFERMEGLGLLELVEEDVALCEFVCTSKQPLQKILREGLDYMQEQA